MGRKTYWVSPRQPGRRNIMKIFGTRFFCATPTKMLKMSHVDKGVNMRGFVKSRFIVLAALTLMVVGLMLAGCGGSSGGGSGDGSGAGTSPPALSGNASSGASTGVSTSKQLTLAWDPVVGATSYEVYWSTVPEVTTANGKRISGISSPSYVHTGLAAGTTYYYVVTATNSTSESAASASASGTTTAL